MSASLTVDRRCAIITTVVDPRRAWIASEIFTSASPSSALVASSRTNKCGRVNIARAIPRRWRWLVLGLPFVLSALMMVLSPRFQSKTTEVIKDVISYRQGSIATSQAQRLDYWHRSLLAFQEKPLIGHGVGSWRMNYHQLGGMQVDAPSNPHQQYLLWTVESGAVGVALFFGILFFQFKGAGKLPENARQTLLTVTFISAVLGFMNCPYFGAGMGECLVYLAACLLSLHQNQTD